MKHDLVFDAVEHSYTIDGRKVPSVTRIIKAVLGSGYEGLPNAEYLMERGRVNHACYALIARGIEFDHDPISELYIAACRKFLKETRPEVIAVEMPVHSYRLQYAGTLDLLARFDGKVILIDWKGSANNRIGYQLAAYAIALEECEGIKVAGGIGVEITGDGSYSTTPVMDLKQERREWPALVTTYGVRRKLNIKGDK